MLFEWYIQYEVTFIHVLKGGNRGSLVSMGKPTSSTLASLAGLFKEKDERAVSQVPDVQSRGDERTGELNETSERETTLQRVRVSSNV